MIDLSMSSMEEVFIITLSVSVIIGLNLGALLYFIFEHDNKEDDNG